MKLLVLLTLLLAPLMGRAQERERRPAYEYLSNYKSSGIVELAGRHYFADNYALWVTEAGPDAFVVADTLTGEPCLDTDETVLSGPPIVYDEALYFIAAEEGDDYPCARSLWRYRPGGRIELLATGPLDAFDLAVIDERFFVVGRDDRYGHAIFEILPEEGTYRGILGADLDSPSMLIRSLTVLDGEIYTTGSNRERVELLWRYDPDTEEANPVGEGVGTFLTPFNHLLLFSTWEEEAGERVSKPWVYDPTTGQTESIARRFSFVHDGRGFVTRADSLLVFEGIAETHRSHSWPGGVALHFQGATDQGLLFAVNSRPHSSQPSEFEYCLFDDAFRRCLPADPQQRYHEHVVLRDVIWARTCRGSNCAYTEIDLDTFEPVRSNATEH